MSSVPIQQGPANVTLNAFLEEAAETKTELMAEQVAAKKESFVDDQKGAADTFAALRNKDPKELKAQVKTVQKSEKAEKSGAKDPEDTAGEFEGRNPELKKDTLLSLHKQIKPDDKKEDILKKVQEFYSDPTLVDEALEFLSQTTTGELQSEVKAAKEEFLLNNNREIVAGQNIAQPSREIAAKYKTGPSEIRDFYRDLTSNPRDTVALFLQLSEHSFAELKSMTKVLFHLLGNDFKSKGPSIPSGELHRLMTETKSLQAVLGVYSFFNTRMPLVDKMFAKEGLTKPPGLNFETMCKAFMSLVAERYPSGDKVLQQAIKLGCDKGPGPKIIAIQQMRDAIKNVAPGQIYRPGQIEELLLVIIEFLEDQEDDRDAELELLSKQELD